jgi:hypothetical protein
VKFQRAYSKNLSTSSIKLSGREGITWHESLRLSFCIGSNLRKFIATLRSFSSQSPASRWHPSFTAGWPACRNAAARAVVKVTAKQVGAAKGNDAGLAGADERTLGTQKVMLPPLAIIATSILIIIFPSLSSGLRPTRIS